MYSQQLRKLQHKQEESKQARHSSRREPKRDSQPPLQKKDIASKKGVPTQFSEEEDLIDEDGYGNEEYEEAEANPEDEIDDWAEEEPEEQEDPRQRKNNEDEDTEQPQTEYDQEDENDTD